MPNISTRHARCVIAATTLVVSAAHAVVTYRVTDLGPGSAKDINNAGQVLGGSADRLYIYSTREGKTFLPEGFESTIPGAAINDAGLVAGSFVFPGNVTHAALFDPANGVRDLGTLGGASSHAYGINNAGQVTGKAFSRSGERAFRYSPATGMVSLGLLGGEQPSLSSSGLGINDAGQVTGFSDLAIGGNHAFVHDPKAGMVDIDTLGGSASLGFAINNAGQVTGNIFAGADHAFLYTPGVGMVRLPTPEGWSTSHGQGINADGVVVGRFTPVQQEGVSRAFIYSSATGAVDLNGQLDPASDARWTLGEALDINDRGQIVGQGFLGKGELPHGFLLTPIPEPETYALMLAGLGALGLISRRRNRRGAS